MGDRDDRTEAYATDGSGDGVSDDVEYGLEGWNEDVGDSPDGDSTARSSWNETGSDDRDGTDGIDLADAFGGGKTDTGSTFGGVDGYAGSYSGLLVPVVAGGAAALFGSTFVPVLGTGLGGAVAGYLQDGDPVRGAKLGAMAGVVGSLPLLLLFVLPFAFALAAGSSSALVGLLVMGVVLVGVGVVSGGLGGLGGYLGANAS